MPVVKQVLTKDFRGSLRVFQVKLKSVTFQMIRTIKDAGIINHI